jgi:hypothetical protein
MLLASYTRTYASIDIHGKIFLFIPENSLWEPDRNREVCRLNYCNKRGPLRETYALLRYCADIWTSIPCDMKWNTRTFDSYYSGSNGESPSLRPYNDKHNSYSNHCNSYIRHPKDYDRQWAGWPHWWKRLTAGPLLCQSEAAPCAVACIAQGSFVFITSNFETLSSVHTFDKRKFYAKLNKKSAKPNHHTGNGLRRFVSTCVVNELATQ